MTALKLRSLPTLMAVLMMCLAAVSCSDHEFKVKGKIDGAREQAVIMEKSDFQGRWIVVDSTHISPSGTFSFKAPSPGAPEVYRLSIDGDYIYFPVDSVETVSVKGSVPGLASNYTLAGTEQAEKMAEFDHLLSRAIATKGDLQSLKRTVFEKYIRDSRGSILSYYVLTKTIDGQPLFDPADREDIKYYAAVATAFKQFKPSDPRARYLEETALRALRDRNAAMGRNNVVEAQELKAIEITLPDTEGRQRKLTESLGRGKPLILVFSLMTDQNSPVINNELRSIQTRGYDIWQISLDADQYGWREAARNLPWINVLDPAGDRSPAALSYNVSRIPAFFLYDASGELTGRADDIEALRKLAK